MPRSLWSEPEKTATSVRPIGFGRLLGLYLGTRLALLCVLVLVGRFEPYGGRDRTPLQWSRGESGPYLYVPERLWDAWVRNDSGHYLQIAALGGYEVPTEPPRFKEGFFPGYPFVIRLTTGALRRLGLLSGSFHDFAYAAVLVSWIAGFLALLGLVRLGEVWLGPRAAWRAGVILLSGPVSFLLSAALTESCFLALTTHAVLHLERGRPLRAAVLGGAACGFRLFGLLLGFPLGLRTLCARADATRKRHALQVLLLVPCGFLAVLWLYARQSADPLTYFHIQNRLLGHAEFPTLKGIAELFDGRRAVLDPWFAGHSFLNAAAVVGSLALLGFQVALTRAGRLPASWLAYSAGLLALPILAGAILSLPRYTLVVFPLFLTAGAVAPGGRLGWALALLAFPLQAWLFLSFEAHWPLVI